MELPSTAPRAPLLRRKPKTKFRYVPVAEDMLEWNDTATPAASPISAPVAHRRPGVSLLDLPQEIQDIIFSLAYPKVDPFKYIIKEDWDFEERERRRKNRDGYTPRPFPQPKVCDFLVSKQFFVAAARAYVGNQTFNRMTGIRLSRPSFDWSRPYVRCLGIAGEFMTEAVIDVWHTNFGDMPPSLKRLTIELAYYQFEILEPKLVWEDYLSDDDCKTVMVKETYDRLVGLQEFHLVPGGCYYANTKAKTDIWHANVRKFESFVRPYGTRPKDAQHEGDQGMTPGQAVPLYRGSKVCFRESKVQEQERPFFNTLFLRELLGLELGSPLADLSSYVNGFKGLRTPISRKSKGRKTSSQNSPPTLQGLLGSPSSMHDAASLHERKEDLDTSGKGRFSDQDIPDDLEGLRALLDTDGENVMKWIRAAKGMGRAVERQASEGHRDMLAFVLTLSAALLCAVVWLPRLLGF